MRLFVLQIILGSFALIISHTNSLAQEKLGKVTFKPEGKEVAQPYFNKGLLYLHSFEYKKAIDQFQTAQMLDPDFTLAFWGEAMCHYYPLWHSQNYEMGKGTLLKLGIFEDDRLALAKNDLEKGLLKTVEELYKEMEPENSRVQNFNKAIESLYKQYSENEEIAAFFALSRISLAKAQNDNELYDLASDICKKILQSNPNHPGALNYLIYANDPSIRAKNALQEAKSYGQIASSSEHALHAPSHIYHSLGMWNVSVQSNKLSWEAGEKRVVENKMSLEDRNYHALWWLQDGYLQQGRFDKAEEMVQDMYLDARMSNSKLTRYHLIKMKLSYLVNTEDWESKVNNTEVPTKGFNITTKIAELFAKGLKAYKTNDLSRLNWVSGQITDMLSMERNKSYPPKQAMFSTCGSDLMNEVSSKDDLKRVEVMELEMQALVANKENHPDKAKELLGQAVKLENELAVIAGPPIIIKPSYELYGELLSHLGEYAAAVDMFDQCLSKYPNRSLSLKGKYHALKNSGKAAEATKTKVALLNNWKYADAGVKSSL